MWATWILYAVLVDLSDAVVKALNRPFCALSMEMVYCNLSHFTVAYHHGKADDPIAYLAADAEGLGIIKRQRKNRGGATEVPYLTIPSPHLTCEQCAYSSVDVSDKAAPRSNAVFR